MKKKRKETLIRKNSRFHDPVHQTGPARISLCMIVKNEAENLADCIHSILPVMDEIIVVDTGSTDATKEIALQLGAKVFDFPWCDDFSAARNESIQHASGDYILWLDGDDRIDKSEIKKIVQLKRVLPWGKNKAYYLLVKSQSPLDGETCFHHMRIFPKIPGMRFEGRVHEQIFQHFNRLGIEQVQTDIVIRHIGYPDAATVLQKSQRNLRLLQEELEKNPEDPILHFNIARTLAGIGRKDQAIFHLKEITENEKIKEKEKKFFLEASLLLGRTCIELNQPERAIPVFQHVRDLFPCNGLVHFCLGESLFLMKKYPEAREEIKKSLLFPVEIGLFPVNLEKLHYYQYYFLGECHIAQEEIDQGRKMFLKSLDLHRDHYKSLQALGLLALQTQKFQDAVEYYERAIQEGAASECNYANLGLAYRKLDRRAEAKKALMESLAINPQRGEAIITLGYLCQKEKEYTKAAEYFSKASDLAPHLIDVRLALSDIYFRSYELDKLVNQCDALLEELNLPRNLTLNNYEELSGLYGKIGECLEQQGRKGMALMAFQVSFLISPLPELIEKMISLAASPGVLKNCLEEVADALQFHGEGNQKAGENQKFLDQISTRAGPGRV